jgi:DNA-binding transcriptional LysR family regulator
VPSGYDRHVAENAGTPRQKVVVYSDNATVRASIIAALGRRPAADLPMVEIVECATHPTVIQALETGTVDLAILDGEAAPAGGMGVARQAKEEIYRCPPLLVIIGRPQDAWLAAWSKADGVARHPIDPFALADAAAGLLRQRAAITA